MIHFIYLWPSKVKGIIGLFEVQEELSKETRGLFMGWWEAAADISRAKSLFLLTPSFPGQKCFWQKKWKQACKCAKSNPISSASTQASSQSWADGAAPAWLTVRRQERKTHGRQGSMELLELQSALLTAFLEIYWGSCSNSAAIIAYCCHRSFC